MESVYKTDTGSDHVAKFRGDRPRELGDLAAKKRRKHHEHFISPPVTPYGRHNYDGIPRAGASNKGGVAKTSSFLALCVNMPKTVGDTSEVTMNY